MAIPRVVIFLTAFASAASAAAQNTGTLDYGPAASAAPVFSNGVELVGGELVVPAGVTSFAVTIATVSDGETEPLETLPLVIGGASGTGSIIP